MPRSTNLTANIGAFLDMIAWSEIGPELLKESDDGYNVLVGSTPEKPLLFHDYSQPPEWYDKPTNSSASGRYQILHRYAVDYIKMLGLPDYSPESQDRIAFQLMNECDVIHLLKTGTEATFSEAVERCSSRWASLPGNDYGQHKNSIIMLRSAFLTAGGKLK